MRKKPKSLVPERKYKLVPGTENLQYDYKNKINIFKNSKRDMNMIVYACNLST
jgi:hypothetical protein